MSAYPITKSNGVLYANIFDEEVIGPVGFPSPDDTYFSSPLNILSLNQGAKQLQVPGNRTHRFTSGLQIKIINSAANNGTFTVATSTFNGLNTIITIVEAIPSTSDPKGQITYQVPLTGVGSIPRTSLALIGQNTVNYGDYVAENFLHLLENFSGTTAPPFGIEGQLWFKSDTDILHVFDGSNWVPINATTSGGSGSTGAPASGSYLVLSPDATLTDERVFSAESGVLNLVDTGPGGTLTISVANGGITEAKLADGSVTAAKLAAGAVSITKLQPIATRTILGRFDTGIGPVQTITLGSEFTLSSTGVLNVTSSGGGGTTTVVSGSNTAQDYFFGHFGESSTSTSSGSGNLNTSTAAAPNTIALRDNVGDLFWVRGNQISPNAENPTISQIMVTNGDNVIRKASLAHLIASMPSSGSTSSTGKALRYFFGNF